MAAATYATAASVQLAGKNGYCRRDEEGPGKSAIDSIWRPGLGSRQWRWTGATSLNGLTPIEFAIRPTAGQNTSGLYL